MAESVIAGIMMYIDGMAIPNTPAEPGLDLKLAKIFLVFFVLSYSRPNIGEKKSAITRLKEAFL